MYVNIEYLNFKTAKKCYHLQKCSKIYGLLPMRFTSCYVASLKPR